MSAHAASSGACVHVRMRQFRCMRARAQGSLHYTSIIVILIAHT